MITSCVEPPVAAGRHEATSAATASPLTCAWLRGPSCWRQTVDELCGPDRDDVGVLAPAGDTCFFGRFSPVRIPHEDAGTLVLAGVRGQRGCGAVTWGPGHVEVESHRGSLRAEHDGATFRVVCRDGTFEARAEALADCPNELPVLGRRVAADGATELRLGSRVHLRCDPYPGRDPTSIASRRARGEDVPDASGGTGLGLEGLGRRRPPP